MGREKLIWEWSGRVRGVLGGVRVEVDAQVLIVEGDTIGRTVTVSILSDEGRSARAVERELALEAALNAAVDALQSGPSGVGDT